MFYEKLTGAGHPAGEAHLTSTGACICTCPECAEDEICICPKCKSGFHSHAIELVLAALDKPVSILNARRTE